MPSLTNGTSMVLLSALSLAGLACSQGDVSTDSASHRDDFLSEPVSDRSQNEAVEHGSNIQTEQSLGPKRRQELEDFGQEWFTSWLPETQAHGAAPPGLPSKAAPAVDGPSASDDVPAQMQELWARFLDRVTEVPQGGFMVQDVAFQDQDSLLDYFQSLYAPYLDKGLVVSSTAWARRCAGTGSSCAPRLDVCWSSGNSTPLERQRVAQVVQAAWPTVTEVQIQFTDGAGNINTCASAAPDGSWEIRIRQDASANRGCSAYGSGSTSPSCSALRGCVGTPPVCVDTTASMVLPTAGSVGSTPAWLDYTAVHEFGHAIGLAHEQIRLEYNWNDPSLPAPPATAPRNCPNADVDITYIPSGLFINDRLTPTDIDPQAGVLAAQTVGSFDEDSIMYYCQQQEDLGSTDPRMSEISVGDIASAQNLYPTSIPLRQGVIRYSSWRNASLQVTFQTATLSLSSTRTPQTATSLNVRVGSTYTASAVPLGGVRLRCPATNHATGVFGNPAVSPPLGFNTDPVRVDCYDPAGLAQVVSALP